MYSERYQLFSRGRLLDGADPEKAKSIIKNKTGLGDSAIDQLMSDRRISIKSDMSWQQAMQYHDFFRNLGLDVFVRLKINADAFESALVPVDSETSSHSKVQSSESLNRSRCQLVCDIRSLRPLVFARSTKLDVSDEDDKNKFKLQPQLFQFGWGLLLPAVLLSALILQKYTAQLLTYNFGMALVATVVSIVVLFGSLIVLPVLLQPLRRFHLSVMGSPGAEYACMELGSFNIKNRSYALLHPGKGVYRIKKNRYGAPEVVCHDVEGNRLYYASNRETLSSESASAAHDVASELIDLMDLYYLQNIRKLRQYLRNLKGKKIVDESTRLVSIYDRQNVTLATVYMSSHLVIEFHDDSLDQDEQVRLFMLAVVAGGG